MPSARRSSLSAAANRNPSAAAAPRASPPVTAASAAVSNTNTNGCRRASIATNLNGTCNSNTGAAAMFNSTARSNASVGTTSGQLVHTGRSTTHAAGAASTAGATPRFANTAAGASRTQSNMSQMMLVQHRQQQSASSYRNGGGQLSLYDEHRAAAAASAAASAVIDGEEAANSDVNPIEAMLPEGAHVPELKMVPLVPHLFPAFGAPQSDIATNPWRARLSFGLRLAVAIVTFILAIIVTVGMHNARDSIKETSHRLNMGCSGTV